MFTNQLNWGTKKPWVKHTWAQGHWHMKLKHDESETEVNSKGGNKLTLNKGKQGDYKRQDMKSIA